MGFASFPRDKWQVSENITLDIVRSKHINLHSFLFVFVFFADTELDSAPASGQIGFAPTAPAAVDKRTDTTSGKAEPIVLVRQVSAQKAVLINPTDRLADGQHMDEVLFHGPKEQNVRVDVGHDSTAQGELLPAPWSTDGNVSELYLIKGCKFEEYTSKNSGGKSESEIVKVLSDPEKLGTYIENLTESDKELKRLHASHIPKESKAIDFDFILKKMGPDETLVAKVECKALINAPATGYDIVSDLVVILTRIKSDTAPGGYQRRVYFFHVRNIFLVRYWLHF